MRAVILSGYPLADNPPYKSRILRGLVERGIESRVLYSGLALRDYYAEARRRGLAREVAARVPPFLDRRNSGSKAPEPERTLREEARALDIETIHFSDLGAPECIAFMESFRPDVVHNLSALYVPPRFLEAAGHCVVGGHYGDLPRVRGVDTIRWSVLLDHPLVVSHMLLASTFDTGDVLEKTPIHAVRGDDVGALRRKCQDASANGHLRIVDRLRAGDLSRKPQAQEEGTTFYRMGAFLRQQVDEILGAGRYSHYVDERSPA